ncbi:MAG TPA: hypothetical protein VG944_05280 [Fimbriimonas sp.]|nr:hypothetical protein [Fimbriimonas sp.]
MVQGISTSVYGLGILLALALDAQPKPFPPIDRIVGSDSYVEQPSIGLATNVREWNAVWQRHKGITPIGNGATGNFPTAEVPPSVDFDHNVVLVIFGGLAPAAGYDVFESTVAKKTVTIRLKPISLNLNGGPAKASFRANPYSFYVYPRTKYPFVVQMPAADQNGNLTWRTVGKVGGTAGRNPSHPSR